MFATALDTPPQFDLIDNKHCVMSKKHKREWDSTLQQSQLSVNNLIFYLFLIQMCHMASEDFV